MSIELEVCIDNLESLSLAIEGGATRIELCSSLALGGLTPSYGLMRQAAKMSSVPVYAMIRPRQGDFLFNELDIECMLEDVRAAKQAGLNGIVIGVLTDTGEVDVALSKKLMAEAEGMGVTFHRAIDQSNDAIAALDAIMSLGCERVLTSGLRSNALDGAQTLKEMVLHCQGKLSIMAGAGVTAENVTTIIAATGVTEVHLSGKSTRPSNMKNQTNDTHMGNADIDDYSIPVTSSDKIRAVAAQLIK
ncbi:copper homeostasis protein CutC [Vibrio tapetis subsp. quintayensis]|uniref:copper homeostasis protein CutC n=1 Tax=Vibrio tapetis TaxID=52443 RepID=UPI0025B50ED8|nr:copper homeostasis protein CutC [Vibrio tapetis]MDN3680142.1 copper homeostasis protein CutC [Vibrio tapetis subsp. quintayensis]